MARSERLGFVLPLFAVATVAACTYDFDQFEAGRSTGGTVPTTGGLSAASGGGGATTAGGVAGRGGSAPRGGSGGEATGGETTGGEATGGEVTGGGHGGASTGGEPPTGGSAGTVTGGASPTGGTGATNTGGDLPTGGSAGANTGGEPPIGGSAGAAGSPLTGGVATGGSPCGTGQKLCGADCVADDDPATGCGEESCNACVVANGVPGCAGGACAIASCDPDHLDCDASAATGCEIGWGQFTDEHCGSCGNSCAAQGYGGGLVCQNSGCVCTSPAQCGNNNGTFDCLAEPGVCTCEGTTCQPGETCSRKVGPDWLCGCNGGSACAPGTTCCDHPAGCRNLQNDSANCGACGWQCPNETTCSDGICS